MAEKRNVKNKITEYFVKGPLRDDTDKQAKKAKIESVNGAKEAVSEKDDNISNAVKETIENVIEKYVKITESDNEANESHGEIVDEDESIGLHFPCSNCDFITGDENEIAAHMEQCADISDLPTQSFKTDEMMEEDTNVDMGGDNDDLEEELQYPCSSCDYFSSDLNEIAAHMATCSGEIDQETEPMDINESKENVNSSNTSMNVGSERIELHFTCSNCDFIGMSEDEVLVHMKECPDDYDLKTQPYYTVYKHDLVKKTYKFVYSSQDQETNKKALAAKAIQKKVDAKVNNKQKLKQIRVLYENSKGEFKRNRVPTEKGSSYNEILKNEMMKKYRRPLKKQYVCDICEFTTDNKHYIMQHVTVTHNDEKPIECKECGYKCKRRGDLTSHMLVHQEKVYNQVCSVCGWSTYKKSKLKVHMRTHTGEKPYKCELCDYATHKSDGLSSHIKTHSLERPHKCDVCGKGFKQSHNLNSHKLIHTGQTPKNHPCNICGYAAVTPHILKQHLLIHTNERPYKCPKCDYSCKIKSNLTVHMIKHSNKKPYVCFECGFSTKLPQTLKRHNKIHKREHCAKPDANYPDKSDADSPEPLTMKLRGLFGQKEKEDKENGSEDEPIVENEKIFVKCEIKD